MLVRLASTIFALLSLLLVPCAPARAEEPTPEARARVHFQQGVDAVQRGELTRAAEQFEAAQALSPNAVVLYNLGQTYSALGRPVEAEAALRRYLESEPRPADPKRLKEVEELIEFNERRIGGVNVQLTPADATLEVDGSRVSPPSAGHIRLAAGRHVFVATKPDYEAAVVNVDVSAGADAAVRLELTASAPAVVGTALPPPVSRSAAARSAEPAPAAPPAHAAPAERKTARRALAFSAMGVGGAAIVASAVFAIEANRLNNESNRDGHCDQSGCDPEGMHLRDAARRNGNWASGLFVSGAVVGAFGLTLYLLEPSSEPTQPKRAARSNLSVRLGAADIAVDIRF